MERLEWYCIRSNLASYRTAQRNGFTADDELCNDEWYTLVYNDRIRDSPPNS